MGINSASDDPESVCEAMLQFEREHGTLETFEAALDKCSAQLKRVRERREIVSYIHVPYAHIFLDIHVYAVMIFKRATCKFCGPVFMEHVLNGVLAHYSSMLKIYVYSEEASLMEHPCGDDAVTVALG